MTQKQDNLESFAKRLETRIKAGEADDSMERQWCRLLTAADTPPVVKAMMLTKWVEWRYGKPKDNGNGVAATFVFDAPRPERTNGHLLQ